MHGWPLYQRLAKAYKNAVYGISPETMFSYFEGQENVFACHLEDFDTLRSIYQKVSPNVIIHAGGVCDLDACEENPELAHAVNVQGTQNMIRLIHQEYLIYISSDLVFCGTSPYSGGYREEHTPTPISVIGKTYLLAEKLIHKSANHAIIRIGLPIGESLPGTKGAVDFIAKRLQNKRRMTLFYDEFRSLIHTDDLAEGVFAFMEKRLTGLFHFGGPQKYSLYDIGTHLVDTRQYEPEHLIRSSRLDEVDGPPRVGDISLNSSKIYSKLDFVPRDPLWCTCKD